jgi:hypothetical protein
VSDSHGMVIDNTWAGCRELNPLVRLTLGNAVAGASDSYTNLAGFPSSTSPIVRQSGNVYQFGIGYTQKPILKQLRRFVDLMYGDFPTQPDSSITNQGSWAEDFIFNALLLNAGISYGQSLTIKNGTATNSVNARPSYSVGMTYALDLERTWVHFFHDSPLNPEDASPQTPVIFIVQSPGLLLDHFGRVRRSEIQAGRARCIE